jgi:hypothetical protein
VDIYCHGNFERPIRSTKRKLGGVHIGQELWCVSSILLISKTISGTEKCIGHKMFLFFYFTVQFLFETFYALMYVVSYARDGCGNTCTP